MNAIDVVAANGGARQAQPLPPLNQDQRAALAAIKAAWLAGKRRFLLEGEAGTGKSTLIAQATRVLSGSIAVCGPTHKSVAVLHRMLLQAGLPVSSGFRQQYWSGGEDDDLSGFDDCAGAANVIRTGTVHSLLGLQPIEDERGKERLVPRSRSLAHGYDIVIIDECSMIGAELQAKIDAECADVFTLFIGDRGQLPPIGEREASCFETVPDRFHLNVIVRQAQGNSIRRISSALRAQQDTGYLDLDWTEGLQSWPAGDAEGAFEVANYADIIATFRSKDYGNNPDYCRLVSFTNGCSIRHNQRIRKAVLGETATPFVAGERCLLRAPVMWLSPCGEPNIILPVNSEPTVMDIQPMMKVITLGGPAFSERGHSWPVRKIEVPAWELRMEHEDGTDLQCCIARDPSMREQLLQRAVDLKRWDDRKRIKAALDDVRHLYSMTAHTAQGSTYEHVFLDMGNLIHAGMADTLTRQRLLYTAATRPRSMLGLYWGEAAGFI